MCCPQHAAASGYLKLKDPFLPRPGRSARQTRRVSEPFRETFRKRYIVERTNKAKIRLEEQSENTESCRENLLNKMQVKGPLERNRHKNRVNGVGKLGWFMSRTQTLTSPPRGGEPAGTSTRKSVSIAFDHE